MLASESPEFAKWKLDYDRSRLTVTRTNYEVDFITAFTKLTQLGTKFDPVRTVIHLRM
jgi:L-ascorbate peroxidase